MGAVYGILRRGGAALDALLLGAFALLPLAALVASPALPILLFALGLAAFGLWCALRIAAPVPAPLTGWGWMALPGLALGVGLLLCWPGLPDLLGVGPLGLGPELRAALTGAHALSPPIFLDPRVIHRLPWTAAVASALLLAPVARDRIRAREVRDRARVALTVGGGLLALGAGLQAVQGGALPAATLLALFPVGAALMASGLESLLREREAVGLSVAALAFGILSLALALAFSEGASLYAWGGALGASPLLAAALRGRRGRALMLPLVGVALGLLALAALRGAGLLGALGGLVKAQAFLSTWPLGLVGWVLGGVALALILVVAFRRWPQGGIPGALPFLALGAGIGAMALVAHAPVPWALIPLGALGWAALLAALEEGDARAFEPTLLWGAPAATAFVPLALGILLGAGLGLGGGLALGLEAARGLGAEVEIWTPGRWLSGGAAPPLALNAVDAEGLARAVAAAPGPEGCLLPWDATDTPAWLACLTRAQAQPEAGIPPEVWLLLGLSRADTLGERIPLAHALLLKDPSLARRALGLPFPYPALFALSGASGGEGAPLEGAAALPQALGRDLLVAAAFGPALPALAPGPGGDEARARRSGATTPVGAEGEVAFVNALFAEIDPALPLHWLGTDGRAILPASPSRLPLFPPAEGEVPPGSQAQEEALAAHLWPFVPDEEAVGALGALHRRHPTSPALARLAARALGEAGRPEAGAALIEGMGVRAPAMEAERLALLAKGGRCAEAQDAARVLRGTYLQDAELQLVLSEVFKACGDRGTHRACLERVIELRPGDAGVRVHLADSYADTLHDRLGGRRGSILKACVAEVEANGPCCAALVGLGGEIEAGEGEGAGEGAGDVRCALKISAP